MYYIRMYREFIYEFNSSVENFGTYYNLTNIEVKRIIEMAQEMIKPIIG